MKFRHLCWYAILSVSLPSSAFNFVLSKERAAIFVSERARLIKRANQESGKPYRWETNGPATFDCSGFVHFVLSEVLGPARFNLPYRLREMRGYSAQSVFYRDHLKQRKAGIACAKAKPGDIVFFPAVTGSPNHIGLITKNKPLIFITAQSKHTGVRAAPFGKGSYWGARKPECFTNIWVK